MTVQQLIGRKTVQFGVALGHLISCPTPKSCNTMLVATFTVHTFCPHLFTAVHIDIWKRHRAQAFTCPAMNFKHRRPSDALQRHVLLGVRWPNLASLNWCGGGASGSFRAPLMDLPALGTRPWKPSRLEDLLQSVKPNSVLQVPASDHSACAAPQSTTNCFATGLPVNATTSALAM